MSITKLPILTLGLVFICFPAWASERLRLAVEVSGDSLEVVLTNESPRSAEASDGYALSGKAGGNIIPIVITEFGQLIPPCSFMDSFTSFRKPDDLAAGATLVIWKGALKSVTRLHCLEAGEYSLAFAYMNPNGTLVFTRNLKIIVDAAGAAAFKSAAR